MAEIGMISQWDYGKGSRFNRKIIRRSSMRNTKSEEKLSAFISKESCLLRRRSSSPEIEIYKNSENSNAIGKFNCSLNSPKCVQSSNFNEPCYLNHEGVQKVKIGVANIIKNPSLRLSSNKEVNQNFCIDDNFYFFEKDYNNDSDTCKSSPTQNFKYQQFNKITKDNLCTSVINKEGKWFNRLHSTPTLEWISEKSYVESEQSCHSSINLPTESSFKNLKEKFKSEESFLSSYSENESSKKCKDNLGETCVKGNIQTINLCRSVPWKFLYKNIMKDKNNCNLNLEEILGPEYLASSPWQHENFNTHINEIKSEINSKYFVSESFENIQNLKNSFENNLVVGEQDLTSRNSSIFEQCTTSDEFIIDLPSKLSNSILSPSQVPQSSTNKNIQRSSKYDDASFENVIYQESIDSVSIDNSILKKLDFNGSYGVHNIDSVPFSPIIDLDESPFISLYTERINTEAYDPNQINFNPRLSITKLYTDFSMISLGRFSHVCCCRDKFNGEHYAVKIIPKMNTSYLYHRGFSSHQLFGFLKSISHPNIVKILRMLHDEHCYYMIMDICRGPTLLEFFMGHLPGTMNEAQVKSIILQLFLALDVLHSHNFAHGDIKLENMMFKNKIEFNLGGSQHSNEMLLPLLNLINLDTIKSLNSGVQKDSYGALPIPIYDTLIMKVANHQNDFYKESEVLGTAPYMSPESHDGILCTASDMWSCGILLYALFDGNFPFHLNEHLPLELRKGIVLNQAPYFDPNVWLKHHSALDLCTRLLDPNPTTRIQSAREALIHEWFTTENFEILGHNYYN